MDISSFPCTQLVFAFSLGWTLKEVNINGDFNQYIWAFSLGWTQETDVRVTSSSLLISSGKPEEVFPTNIFSVLNECPPLSTEPKLFNTIPTQFLLSHFYPHWFSTEPSFSLHQLNQQTTWQKSYWINRHLPTRPSCFCWQNCHIVHVELGWFVGPCKNIYLLYWRTGVNETYSLLWLARLQEWKW